MVKCEMVAKEVKLNKRKMNVDFVDEFVYGSTFVAV